MSIFTKVIEAAETQLDSIIEKSKSDRLNTNQRDRKGLIEIDYAGGQQLGYQERTGMVGPQVLKSMARKDSVIAAIIQTRKSQVSAFSQPQKDRYTPGFLISPVEKLDLTLEEKIELADPSIQDPNTDEYEQKKYEMEKKRVKRQKVVEEDRRKIEEFIMHCGWSKEEEDMSKRMDFECLLKLMVGDRLTYNYVAIECIPTKDGTAMHHFLPVSSGTIRYVTRRSAEKYTRQILEFIHKDENGQKQYEAPKKPFRYIQIVRGRIVAAWTEDELIFEAANPTVDPEDQNYGNGEMELLIQIITSHIYAESHNRNFFTQGIGSKGILHIKGDNISRGQLEGFKRQWFNQISNTRNAFRPPIIGMADDVKWVSLSMNNREMEYENWMNYLIKLSCAIFQIDPAEINFDISKTQTSTLNETSNEQRLKSSKDKGLKPLLKYIENIINNRILPKWDKELAQKYKFEFVGLDAETKKQEAERFKEEATIWKTVNEIRAEMGYPNIEGGDIVLNAAYTQYLAQIQQLGVQEEDASGGEEGEDEEAALLDGIEDGGDIGNIEGLLADLENADKKVEQTEKDKEKDKEKAKTETTKKSRPDVIEYYVKDFVPKDHKRMIKTDEKDKGKD